MNERRVLHLCYLQLNYLRVFAFPPRLTVLKPGQLCAGGSPKVPLVVRLQGNNVEGAMELMKNSDIKCILGDDLDDGAK